jgi:hypothetical protein
MHEDQALQFDNVIVLQILTTSCFEQVRYFLTDCFLAAAYIRMASLYFWAFSLGITAPTPHEKNLNIRELFCTSKSCEWH